MKLHIGIKGKFWETSFLQCGLGKIKFGEGCKELKYTFSD